MISRHHRTTAVLSAGALALALAACGSDEEPTDPEGTQSSEQEDDTEKTEEPADGDEPDGEPEAPAEPELDDVPWDVTFDGEPFEIRPDSHFQCHPGMDDGDIQIDVIYMPPLGSTAEERQEYENHQFTLVIDESEDPASVVNVTIGHPFESLGITYSADNSPDDPGIYADVEIIDDYTFHVEGASINLGDTLAGYDDQGEAIEHERRIIPFEITVTCPEGFRDSPPVEDLVDLEDLEGLDF